MIKFGLTFFGDILVFAGGVFVGSKGKDWAFAVVAALWGRIKATLAKH